jgi:acyl-CoA synthetase (AMP-forming)/AMP-acid ligase II
MNIIDFFDRGASLDPERPFLVIGDRIKTYRQSQQASRQIASAFSACGLGAGSRVAIYSPNDDVAFECLFGLFRAGCAWVPINARNSVQENAQILRNADVDALLFHSTFETAVPQLREHCPGMRMIACLDRESEYAPSVQSWSKSSDISTQPALATRDDIYGIYSTGGTTGTPKGVVQTNLVMETKVASFLIHTPPRKPPVYLMTAPWTHAAGSVAQCLTPFGVTVIIHPKFDALEVLRTIERHHVTYIYLPPTAIYMLLAHPDVRRFNYSRHLNTSSTLRLRCLQRSWKRRYRCSDR